MTNIPISIACLAALLCSCRKSEITVNDLMRAQGIVPFVVELPKNIRETDTVFLEIFGESGVIDSAVFTDGLEPGEMLKIFIHKASNEYRFSVVTESVSMNDMELKLGEAELRAMRGSSNTEVFEVGDPLAGFTVDGTVSYMNPRGDDLSLRIAVKSGSEQVAAPNP